jgi:hypothetical protein
VFTFRCSYLILLLLACLLTTRAYANGINPPQPSGAKTLEALCTDRKNGNVVTVQRAQMTTDKTIGLLEVRLEKSGPHNLQLSQINRVQIATGKPSSDGFAKASFELLNPSYKGGGFIRLRVNGKPVHLTGFSDALEHIEIPLQSCRVLTLKEPRSSESVPREVTMPTAR